VRLADFAIGREFWMGGRRWRCTDVGARVAVAICLEEPTDATTVIKGVRHVWDVTEEQRPSFHRGPPYAVTEHVIDEDDMDGCRLTAAEWKADFGGEGA
jgi:hypothetical protein